ncbi:MAG: TRAP transporter TatT component family protein [Spirochaetaceae bacterium]|nr:MAG: TRAP transporter TatT component family protein [Spirochaetaceae bacterium]
MHKRGVTVLLSIVAVFLTSCSINKLAVNMVAKTLSSGDGTVFTGEEDPQLVADALPFAMKLYESLLEQTPENEDLLLTTGSIFTMYANAFVQTPAGMLPESEYEQQQLMLMRAKKLYLRGRAYLLRAMELRYPGFGERLKNNELEQALAPTVVDDVPFLFWTSASWLGAFSTDTFDMELLLGLPKPIALLNRALELDDSYSNGMIHDTLISIYGSLPEAMGGSQDKARYHFEKAVEYSGGLSPSPYVALASTVSVANQNVDEFRKLLNQAIAIDPETNPDNRLQILLAQEKARWLLDHIEDFFLLDPGEEAFEEGDEW